VQKLDGQKPVDKYLPFVGPVGGVGALVFAEIFATFEGCLTIRV